MQSVIKVNSKPNRSCKRIIPMILVLALMTTGFLSFSGCKKQAEDDKQAMAVVTPSSLPTPDPVQESAPPSPVPEPPKGIEILKETKWADFRNLN